jgi:hypothetical protein
MASDGAGCQCVLYGPPAATGSDQRIQNYTLDEAHIFCYPSAEIYSTAFPESAYILEQMQAAASAETRRCHGAPRKTYDRLYA